MTAKEKVLKVHPDAEVNKHAGGTFSVTSMKAKEVLGIGNSAEAAWQNAAESLPAQPEPVAPVEAKEKEPICATCNEPIYQRNEFGDKAWCHMKGGAIMSNGHVAEPKPTPSTPAPNEKGTTMSSEPKQTPYIYQPYGIQNRDHWASKRIYAVASDSMLTTLSGLTKEEAEKIIHALKPRSDSSSISTEPEQIVDDDEIQEAIDDHRTLWSEEIAIELQQWRKWAKGQR